MAAAHVNTATGTSDASATSLAAGAANHTTGNLIVVQVSWTTAGVTSTVPTDTAGNTYVSTTQKGTDGTNNFVETFYAKNITGNASNVVTAHFSAGATFRRIQVLQYSGADITTPLDTGNIGTGTGTALTTASFTTTASGVIVVGASCNNNRTYSAGSGFTARVTSLGTDTGTEDKVGTTAGAQTGPFTISSSATWWEAAVGFKDASAGSIKTVAPATINGAATVTATVVKTAVLGPTVNGAATVTATVVRTRVLSASVAGSSTVSATVVRTRVLAATVNGASTVTATVVRIRAIPVAINGASTVAATVVKTAVLAPAVNGSSTVTVGIVRTRVLVATVNGVTVVTATVTNTNAPAVTPTDFADGWISYYYG